MDRCLWADDAPPAARAPATLPERCDVAVVGGGYTGLAAARALARRGASVTVLERHTIGWGASGRNGGFVLPGYKPEIEALARKHGLEEARRLFRLSLDAIAYLESLIAEEGIACDYRRCGTVTLAARPGHLRSLTDNARFQKESLEYDTHVLGVAELREEIGSARYHGGLLDPGAGSLHPGRYLLGLAASAERAGAVLLEVVEVRSVRRDRDSGHLIETSRGVLRARDVLVATNGYTGPAFPELQRRVVPVGSYIIATVPLDPAFSARLIPRGRVLSDTKNLLYYFRLSPDRRMVFGGRAAFTPMPVARAGALLVRAMTEVFPELSGAKIEYAWGGRVAFALDHMPHAGLLGGLHYALAYAGHGVAMSTWLGARMGDAIAGAGPMPILTAPFRAVPLYRGKPWFLPLVGAYYRVKDRF
jgi:glycine/D-amino acid oxidase-like deaminating enzyme